MDGSSSSPVRLDAAGEEEEDMKQTVEQVLAAKGIRTGGGGLLFAMTAGSVAFNLSVEGSDRDYFAGSTPPTAATPAPHDTHTHTTCL